MAGLSLATLYRAEEHLFPIANLDDGELSRRLVEELEKAPALRVEAVSPEEGRRLVGETPRAGAALVIPEGFSEAFHTREPLPLQLLTDPVKNIEVFRIKEAVERVRAGLVATHVASRISVVQVLTHAGDVDLEALSRDSGELAERLLERSVGLDEQSVYGGALGYNTFDQNVPGFSVTFLLLGMLFGVGLGLLDEGEWGMLERIAPSRIGPGHLAVGKVLSRFLVGLAQMLVLFAFGRVAFGVSLGPSLTALGLVIIAVAFASAAFGLLAAALAPTRESVLPLGTMAVVAMAAIGGCWWPITFEPYWLQRLAHVFPTAWAMGAFNDLMLRQRELAEVLPAILALFGFGAAYLLAGFRLYERRHASW